MDKKIKIRSIDKDEGDVETNSYEEMLETAANIIYGNLNEICGRENIELDEDIKGEISFKSAVDIFDNISNDGCPGCPECIDDFDGEVCPGCPECEAEMLDEDEDFDEELEDICEDCRNKIDWDKN